MRQTRNLRPLLSILLLAAASWNVAADTPMPELSWPKGKAELRFTEATLVTQIYRVWGEAFGIRVIFDPKFKDSRATFDLGETTAKASLTIFNRSLGHFAKVLDEKTILLADDTPQNRRRYEEQVIRTFPLENVELKDAMTLIRSLIGAKNVAAVEGLDAMVLRDTEAKVDVAAAILSTIDRPRAEVEVDVEVFHLEGAKRADFLAALDKRRGPLPRRLSAAQLDRLRAAASTLAEPGLNLFDGQQGGVSFKDTWTVSASPEAVHHLEVGIDLAVQVWVHPKSGEVRFEATLAVHEATADAPRGPIVGLREMTWGARLPSGTSFLASGFLRTGERPGGGAESGSLLVPFFAPPKEGRGEILVAITPTIVRVPVFSQEDLAGFYVGTESNITSPAPAVR